MATIIRREGSPFWYARFMFQGKPYLISTKKKDKKEAQVVADAEEQTHRQNRSLNDYFNGLLSLLSRLPPDERDGKRREFARLLLREQTSKLTVADAWKAWIDSPLKGNPQPSTVRGYEAIWRRFKAWASIQAIEYMHEVSALHAQDYAADLWHSNIAPRTYNGAVKFLRGMFRTLDEKAGLTANPWARIKTLAKDTQSRENFSADELRVICAKATGSFRYMIGVGLYTGLRLADVINLRWQDIHREMIQIVPSKTRRKGKKLTVPLHPVLASLLHELKNTSEGEYLFAAERDAYQRGGPTAVTKPFQLFLSETCGIKTTEEAIGHRKRAIVRKGFHSLRHSFVSLCAANRVPQVAIQELVGHGSPAMTELYSHADFDQKQNAIATLPSMVFANGSSRRRQAGEESALTSRG